MRNRRCAIDSGTTATFISPGMMARIAPPTFASSPLSEPSRSGASSTASLSVVAPNAVARASPSTTWSSSSRVLSVKKSKRCGQTCFSRTGSMAVAAKKSASGESLPSSAARVSEPANMMRGAMAFTPFTPLIFASSAGSSTKSSDSGVDITFAR